MVAGRPRVAPARCPDRRGPAHVRGASLPRAVPVRRAHRRPRHDPERRPPCPDRRRHGRLGLRVDAAGERLGVPGGALRRQPRRDDVARRRAAPAHRGVRRQRPSDRPVSRARARLRQGRGGHVARAAADRPDSEAVHAGGGERVRRRPPRCLRQGLRRQLLRDVRCRLHAPRPVARPRACLRGGVPRSLRAVGAAGTDAGLPFGRRQRPHRRRRRDGAARRRAAQLARGVDRPGWVDALQDQAEWRQRRGRLRSDRPHRSHRPADPGVAGRRLEVPARFQRGVPERPIPAGSAGAGQGGDRRTDSPASSTSSSRPPAIWSGTAPT